MSRQETNFDKVKEFSAATGGFPTYSFGSEFENMKLGLITEEYNEVADALDEDDEFDKVKQAALLKEFCDLLYVVYGYALYRGWDIDTAFNRVHKSNMSKIPADGIIRKREDGKVLKPDTYLPPDLKDLV